VSVRVVDLDRSAFAALQDEVLDVYAAAMGVPPDAARARRSILATHLERDGLQAVGAFVSEAGAAGRLVGIAYGYRGAPGQWWHDQVWAALDEQVATRWVAGAFEVCEFHVRPEQQGTGLGRELISRLLSLTDARTAVLTTPDADTRARRFYRRAGWIDLVGDLRFPGDPRAFAVLALPLRP
jgi:GNAT superfamily N-acetyltransferase